MDLSKPTADPFDSAKKGKISLERVVEACATAPAQLFRMANKGAIQVGMDADLVLVDTELTATVTDEEVLSKIGHSPYTGQTYTGMPVETLIGGETVFKGGKVIGKPGTGTQSKRVNPPMDRVND